MFSAFFLPCSLFLAALQRIFLDLFSCSLPFLSHQPGLYFVTSFFNFIFYFFPLSILFYLFSLRHHFYFISTSHLFFLFYLILEKICSTFLYFSQDTNNNFFSKIKEVSDHEFERSKRWGPWDKLEEERWERNNYNLIKIFFRLVYPFNWICYILFILH